MERIEKKKYVLYNRRIESICIRRQATHPNRMSHSMAETHIADTDRERERERERVDHKRRTNVKIYW